MNKLILFLFFWLWGISCSNKDVKYASDKKASKHPEQKPEDYDFSILYSLIEGEFNDNHYEEEKLRNGYYNSMIEDIKNIEELHNKICDIGSMIINKFQNLDNKTDEYYKNISKLRLHISSVNKEIKLNRSAQNLNHFIESSLGGLNENNFEKIENERKLIIKHHLKEIIKILPPEDENAKAIQEFINSNNNIDQKLEQNIIKIESNFTSHTNHKKSEKNTDLNEIEYTFYNPAFNITEKLLKQFEDCKKKCDLSKMYELSGIHIGNKNLTVNSDIEENPLGNGILEDLKNTIPGTIR